jgi:hypothetical protein
LRKDAWAGWLAHENEVIARKVPNAPDIPPAVLGLLVYRKKIQASGTIEGEISFYWEAGHEIPLPQFGVLTA